jgi:hypothetical protein
MNRQISTAALLVAATLTLSAPTKSTSHVTADPLPDDCSAALTLAEIAVVASHIHNGPDDDELVEACIEAMSNADADAVFEAYADLEGHLLVVD